MSLSPQDTLPRELPRPAPGGFFTDRSPPQGETQTVDPTQGETQTVDPPQGETQTVDPTQMFQNFWRCAHHPSSIDNFFAGRTTCEWECHTQELRWHHNGTHPLPPSWPAHP